MAIWHVVGRPINFDSIDSARHEDPRWDHWCIWHDFIVILICYRSIRLVRILVIHLDIFAICNLAARLLLFDSDGSRRSR